MAVATGMRLKEVVGLRWSDMNRNAGVVHVSENSKTGRRDIPMSDTVRDVLDGLVRHLRSPMVFVDDEGNDYTSERRRGQDHGHHLEGDAGRRHRERVLPHASATRQRRGWCRTASRCTRSSTSWVTPPR